MNDAAAGDADPMRSALGRGYRAGLTFTYGLPD